MSKWNGGWDDGWIDGWTGMGWDGMSAGCDGAVWDTVPYCKDTYR